MLKQYSCIILLQRARCAHNKHDVECARFPTHHRTIVDQSWEKVVGMGGRLERVIFWIRPDCGGMCACTVRNGPGDSEKGLAGACAQA